MPNSQKSKDQNNQINNSLTRINENMAQIRFLESQIAAKMAIINKEKAKLKSFGYVEKSKSELI